MILDQQGTRTTVWNDTWGMGLARVSNSYPHTQFRTFPIALAVITTKMVIPKQLTSDRARWTELYIKYFLRAVQFIISRSEEARCWSGAILIEYLLNNSIAEDWFIRAIMDETKKPRACRLQKTQGNYEIVFRRIGCRSLVTWGYRFESLQVLPQGSLSVSL